MRKSFYIILVCLLISSIVSASEETPDPQIDALYLRASMYDYEGNFEEAADIYEAILEEVESEHVYSRLADDYARLNDGQSLKLTLERGLRHNPSSVLLMGKLADFYKLSSETIVKAYELYNRAYELSKDEQYLEGLAGAYSAKQDYNGAIAIYNKLIEKEKKSEYYSARGRLYGQLGLEKESVDDYTSAVELDGNYYAAGRLADYYLAKNNGDMAVKYLTILLTDSPDNIIAKFRLAELLKKLGKLTEAVRLYESLTNSLTGDELNYVLQQLASHSYIEKDYKKTHEYFARAYEAKKDIKTAYSSAISAEAYGDLDEAEKWYHIILDERSDFTDARKRLSIIYLKKDKPDEALKIISETDNTLMDVEFLRVKAEAYTMKKDFVSAEKTLMDAITENPEDIKLRMDLALLYDSLDNKEKAVETAKEGLKRNPENESLLNFLGYMYADQGIMLKEAKSMIEKALKVKPDEAAYLDSMGWVLYKMGKYRDAYKFQQRALKASPNEQEIVDHMKAILKKLGKNKSIEDVIKEN